MDIVLDAAMVQFWRDGYGRHLARRRQAPGQATHCETHGTRCAIPRTWWDAAAHDFQAQYLSSARR